MLWDVSFARRWRRRLRRRYWVLARSVWRIERRRLRFGLCVVVVVVGFVSAEEAARSSIVSIFIVSVDELAFVCFFVWNWGPFFFSGELTCIRTRSIIRSMSGAGQGRTSETARSATQNRVRSWWSRAADSGLAPAPWSTEARMSSMSMVFSVLARVWN